MDENGIVLDETTGEPIGLCFIRGDQQIIVNLTVDDLLMLIAQLSLLLGLMPDPIHSLN